MPAFLFIDCMFFRLRALSVISTLLAYCRDPVEFFEVLSACARAELAARRKALLEALRILREVQRGRMTPEQAEQRLEEKLAELELLEQQLEES